MRIGALTLAGLCALVLGACSDTVQQKPIPHNILEGLIAAPAAVYWLGATFEDLPIIEAANDPGGAHSIEYGPCLQGGQGACMPPLRIITSPDNSFLPGGQSAARAASIRGVPARLSQGGRTITIATGAVVVDIYAINERLARAAAETMVPINDVGRPAAPLPARLPDSGFGATPLPSQTPSPLHRLG